MSNNSKKSHSFAFVGFKKAVIGGFIAGAIAITSQLLVGRVYQDWEAKMLFEAITTSSRYLDSAAAGGSSTIIALMLTMLSMGSNKKVKVESEFFKRIETITIFSTITLIAAVIQLQIFSMPITESQEVDWIFNFLYYFMIVYVAVVAGLMVATVLMLKDAVSTLIEALRNS